MSRILPNDREEVFSIAIFPRIQNMPRTQRRRTFGAKEGSIENQEFVA
jgi:hypothetical protein